MTLPVSGPISMADVNTELQLSSTATISLNDTNVRTLFGVPSGAISMSDGYGKEYMKSLTISANQTDLNLRTYALANGWSTSQLLQVTINPGVYLLASSTSASALTVSGSFPSGVKLINNGVIVGYGGVGGAGGSGLPQAGFAGSAGGTGITVSTALSITNNGTVAGGGGGGGGGSGLNAGDFYGGGGGGGGATYAGGGPPGLGTGPGTGRAAAGATATLTTGGAGGGAAVAGAGAAGGNWGATGGTGNASDQRSGGAGGAAGNYVNGNAFVTWLVTGTRLGGSV